MHPHGLFTQPWDSNRKGIEGREGMREGGREGGQERGRAVKATLRPRGGMSHMEESTLLGIHSTK